MPSTCAILGLPLRYNVRPTYIIVIGNFAATSKKNIKKIKLTGDIIVSIRIKKLF